jgi:hypothetical protein
LFELMDAGFEFGNSGVVLEHDAKDFAQRAGEIGSAGDVPNGLIELMNHALDVSFDFVGTRHTFCHLV